MACYGAIAYLAVLIACVAVVLGIETEQKLIFEEGSISIHSGVNLSSTFNAIIQVKSILVKMNRLQSENDILTKLDDDNLELWDKYKVATISRLSSKLERVSKRLENCFAKNPTLSKNRRAIEFLGNLISYVTGVPSPSEWRLNQININHLKQAMIDLNTKGDIEGRMITTNEHHIDKLHKSLDILCKQLNLTLGKVNSMENGIRSNLIFNTLKEGSLELLEGVEETVRSVEKIMEKGRLHLATLEGLSDTFTHMALLDIQARNRVLSPIYSSFEVTKYYNLPTATITIHDRQIWTSLKIPLVNFSKYYNQIRIGTQYHDEIVSLARIGAIDPLWFTDNHDIHTIVSRKAVDSCLNLYKLTLCEGRNVFLRTKFDGQSNYLTNFWTETNTKNYFAYINANNITVQIGCSREHSSTTLGTRGVIYISTDCELKSESVHIPKLIRPSVGRSHTENIHYHNIDIDIEQEQNHKKFNSFVDTQIAALLNWTNIMDSKNLSQLSNKVNRSLEQVTTHSFHTVTGFSLLGTALAGVIFVLILVICKLKLTSYKPQKLRVNLSTDNATNNRNEKVVLETGLNPNHNQQLDEPFDSNQIMSENQKSPKVKEQMSNQYKHTGSNSKIN